MNNSSNYTSGLTYNPLAPDTISDPFRVYEQLRDKTPIFWHDELYSWVLSKYEHCSFVLQNHKIFTQDRRKLGRPVPDDGMTIQSLDPPDQLPLRQAMFKALKKVDTANICAMARAELERCTKTVTLGQPFDYMQTVAAPAATVFACKLVGVAPIFAKSYLPIFLGLTRAMDAALEPERQEEGRNANIKLLQIVSEYLKTPNFGGIISHLAPLVRDMPTPYVCNTLAATFNAAFSTAYSTMASILALTIEKPTLVSKIVSNNVEIGVQELLRYLSPAQATTRYATQDIHIDGIQIAQNDPIVTLLAAANRDPMQFKRPNEIWVERTPNPHLGFGSGPHYCIGASPAIKFLAMFVQFLHEYNGNFSFANKPVYLNTATLRCFSQLQVIL